MSLWRENLNKVEDRVNAVTLKLITECPMDHCKSCDHRQHPCTQPATRRDLIDTVDSLSALISALQGIPNK